VRFLKVVCVMMTCVMIAVMLPGCAAASPFISERLKLLDSKTMKEKQSNLQMSKDILNCLSENDAQGLKALLCLKTQGLTDIDKQILSAFDFFKGRVVSFNQEDLSGYEEESIDGGKTTFLERSWRIQEIKTDEGATYEIDMNAYIVCDDDKDREGISQITITSGDGTEFKIGYRWPLHYDEGLDLSIDVVKCFDERDADGLKAMLCTKTQQTEGIDRQIQSGLNFLEGRATFGKVGTVDGHDLFDGDHDWNAYVDDKEKVENGQPTRTSIAVRVENIEMDTGKIYRLKFYAILLCREEKSLEGISQIIIQNDEGKELAIGERVD